MGTVEGNLKKDTASLIKQFEKDDQHVDVVRTWAFIKIAQQLEEISATLKTLTKKLK